MRAPATPASSPAPTRRRTILLALALALGAVLALGACSSSTPATTTTSSSAAGTTPGSVPESTPGTSASASGTTPPGTATRPGTTPGTTPGTAPSSSTTTNRGPNPGSDVKVTAENAAFCARTNTARKEFAALDPSNEAASLATYKAILGELATLAPPAIQADWTAVNGVIQSAATLAELKTLDTPEFDAATKRIDEWSTANCGFNLSDG